MGRIRIYPYGVSKSAKALTEALNAKRIKRENSTFHAREGDLVINWGSSVIPSNCYGGTLLNSPSSVALASNKLETFRKLSTEDLSSCIPSYTTNKEEAVGWILEDGAVIYARSLLKSSQGRGITIHSDYRNLPDVPLYVKSIPCSEEYRVHVFKDSIIHLAQKKRMRMERLIEENITPNPAIKNRGNGYIFAQEDINVPSSLIEASKRAIEALGLDFGAVDIGVAGDDRHPVIFEINTAPGLEGTTLRRYAEVFNEVL